MSKVSWILSRWGLIICIDIPDGRHSSPPPFVRVLDASHNDLLKVPKAFLDAVSPAMLSLDLSYNKITEIESQAFEKLSRLQELQMSHNQVSLNLKIQYVLDYYYLILKFRLMTSRKIRFVIWLESRYSICLTTALMFSNSDNLQVNFID